MPMESHTVKMVTICISNLKCTLITLPLSPALLALPSQDPSQRLQCILAFQGLRLLRLL